MEQKAKPRTLMHRQIAPITKHDCVAVFSFGIIAYGTGRIFRGHGKVWLWDILGLHLDACHQLVRLKARGYIYTPSQTILSLNDP